VNSLRLNQNMLKTLNPTPGHEQMLGRFIGSLWAMNPGHSPVEAGPNKMSKDECEFFYNQIRMNHST
jgi:hypothetical protein